MNYNSKVNFAINPNTMGGKCKITVSFGRIH